MSRLGSDAAQLDALASRMVANAQMIDSVIARAGALLDQAWWEGLDAQIFREQWVNGSSQLRQLTAALTEAGMFAARSAEQQRGASQ